MDHPSDRQFATTHWSIVIGVRDGASPAALEELCRTYWYPIYGYIRRKGHTREDAEDLTQGFITTRFTEDALSRVTEEKGSFRVFLIKCLKNFLFDAHDRQRAWKRGGKHSFLSFDAMSGEERFQLEPRDAGPPEELFDRNWAQTIAAEARAALKKECSSAGKADQLEALQGAVFGAGQAVSYALIARQLGQTESAIKTWVLRTRKRFREILQSAIAQTVSSRKEVEEELRYLAGILAKYEQLEMTDLP